MRASARDYFAPRTKVSGTPPREDSPPVAAMKLTGSSRWSSMTPPAPPTSFGTPLASAISGRKLWGKRSEEWRRRAREDEARGEPLGPDGCFPRRLLSDERSALE